MEANNLDGGGFSRLRLAWTRPRAGAKPVPRSAGSPPRAWLPPGKTCAICFSVDDVHPGRVEDGFEAGGDLEEGVLGEVLHLLRRHPELRAGLCVTPDWRPIRPYPTRRLLAALPALARRFYLAERWPKGRMRLDRHPAFVAFLKTMPRVEIIPHGLHHIQRGTRVPMEFENASYRACADALAAGDAIMKAAGLTPSRGHVPPGWAAPPPLRRAMKDAGLTFLVSARDLETEIQTHAVAAMSGLRDQPLIFPGWTEEGLVHIPVNFQATSEAQRAVDILECGGLLSIKAHAVKSVGTYTALDGLDRVYGNYLDSLFAQLKARFGDRIWWASMGEIADRFAGAALERPAVAAVS